MRRILLALLLPALAHGAPLNVADQTSVATLQASLASDPFAEEPLQAMGRIYERGPGRAALLTDVRRRAAAASATDLVVLGRVALAAGERQEATKALVRAGAMLPRPQDQRRLARLLDQAGATDEALRAYKAGLPGANPTEARTLQLRMGVLFLAAKKPADAIAIWRTLKQQLPNDQALRRQIVEAMAGHGLVQEALAELTALEPLVEKDPQALLSVLRREGDLCRRSGNRTQGTQALVRAYRLAAELKQPTLRGEITVDLLRLYKADALPAAARRRAIEPLLDALKKTEGAAATSLRGEVLAAAGDRAAATTTLRQALKQAPSDPHLLRQLAAISSAEERGKLLTELFQLERNDPSIGIELVSTLFERKDAAQGTQIAQQLRARFPDSPPILAEIGRVLSKHGAHAEALVTHERLYALEPQSPDALIAYGDALRAVGRGSEAVPIYFRLTQKNPSLTSHRHLIEVLSQRQLTTEVKRAYQEALRAFPEDTLRRDYARWLSKSGTLEEAIAEWKQLAASSRDQFLQSYATREIERLEHQKLFNH